MTHGNHKRLMAHLEKAQGFLDNARLLLEELNPSKPEKKVVKKRTKRTKKVAASA